MIPFYDIHCHLLPGVDDGSKDLRETLEAFKIARSEGIRRLILTPHFKDGSDLEYSEKIRRVFQETAELLKKDDSQEDLQIWLGSELFYTDRLAEHLKQKETFTLAESRYILVEFLPDVRYETICRALRNLTEAGYFVILAHMERYQCLMEEKERILKLKEDGMYLQINTSCLTGKPFRSGNSFVKKLCREGVIDFMATDSHGARHRQPRMKEAADWLIHACGRQKAYKILFKNPQAVLDDKII